MSDHNFENTVVVITGASSGLGKGSALEFAKCGALLGLAARRADLLEELSANCGRCGGRAVPIPTDVSRAHEVESLVRRVMDEFGRIDVWVNNAGVAAVGRFEDVPLADHVQVIQTDLLGTLYGSYYAMQQFRRQNRGILINVSSVLGKIPSPYYSSYAAAKHGVAGLSASIRLELAQNNIKDIHVCTVLPTSTDTPLFEHAANYSGHEFLPTPPVYQPEDVIDAIVKLAAEPEDQIAVGSAAQLALLAHNLAPDTTESQVGKKTHQRLTKEARPAEDTEGNVHQPSPAGTGIHGKQRND